MNFAAAQFVARRCPANFPL